MTGMILWREPEKGTRSVQMESLQVLHTRFPAAFVVRGPRTPELAVRRRVQRAAGKLRRAGVTRAVTPAEFPYGIQMEKGGVRPVSTVPLRRALAAELVRRETARRGDSPGSVRLAVTAAAMTGELVRTVTELALGYRYVLLDIPYGGEELARQLRREYGVTLLLRPTREQLEAAEVLLAFDRRTDLSGKNPVVVPLWEGASAPLPALTLPPDLDGRLPAGADRLALLTALVEAGAVRPGQILVGA